MGASAVTLVFGRLVGLELGGQLLSLAHQFMALLVGAFLGGLQRLELL